MGQYFRMVCHECKVYMRPTSAKLAEIALNPLAAASVGWFCVAHAGHPIELRGDSWTYDHLQPNHDENGQAYRLMELDELARLDEDIGAGRVTLARWRKASGQ